MIGVGIAKCDEEDEAEAVEAWLLRLICELAGLSKADGDAEREKGDEDEDNELIDCGAGDGARKAMTVAERLPLTR